ncbi:MAG: HAD hydrolase family protein [Acidobacteria bacterium]|nr:HAD hydrolase family protein [Acidobacteriota bacterium]
MHLTILACDLDGTLIDGPVVTENAWKSLRVAKNAGIKIILVTGRIFEDLISLGPLDEICEAIVAENGAVVYVPGTKSILLPFGRISPGITRKLEQLSIPLEKGLAMVASCVPHDEKILQVLHESAGGATLEYNRRAVMVLPPGATKATGLDHALRELDLSMRNVLGCGDAENDRALFEAVELGVAVANASPAIQRLADSILMKPNGTGVGQLIESLASGQLPPRRLRPERRVLLGRKSSQSAAYLDPFLLLNKNFGIAGASGSGKTWLGGILAEGLLNLGYQVCIVDPEGDFRTLRTLPHTLLVGGPGASQPSLVDIANVFVYSTTLSVIVDLSCLPKAESPSYVIALIQKLIGARKRCHRPHWILMDELQMLCPPEGQVSKLLGEAMKSAGGYCGVTYRPSAVDPCILNEVHGWFLTRLSDPQELGCLSRIFSGERPHFFSELASLQLGEAYMYTLVSEPWLPPMTGFFEFQMATRAVPHVRHLSKYLHLSLPHEKRFCFREPGGAVLAAASNLLDFKQVLKVISTASIEYHLYRKDFERWIEDVLQDNVLARRIGKTARRQLHGEDLRQLLNDVIEMRCGELKALT